MYCGPREREQYPLWQILTNCHLAMVALPYWLGHLGFLCLQSKSRQAPWGTHFHTQCRGTFPLQDLVPWPPGLYQRPLTETSVCQQGLYSQSYGFPSSHVWVLELYHKEGWALKKWCFWTMVLEKTLESPLDCKEINPVNPKGNQSWIFTGRTNTETEAPILWPPDVKNWQWKRPWCWERLKAGGERGDREWDGWMASMTQ